MENTNTVIVYWDNKEIALTKTKLIIDSETIELPEKVRSINLKIDVRKYPLIKLNGHSFDIREMTFL